MSDLREKLARMTVENGASLNEERIAKEKMAKYTDFIKKEKPRTHPQQTFDDPMPLHEQRFLAEWFKVKMANRRKWGVG